MKCWRKLVSLLRIEATEHHALSDEVDFLAKARNLSLHIMMLGCFLIYNGYVNGERWYNEFIEWVTK